MQERAVGVLALQHLSLVSSILGARWPHVPGALVWESAAVRVMWGACSSCVSMMLSQPCPEAQGLCVSPEQLGRLLGGGGGSD